MVVDRCDFAAGFTLVEVMVSLFLMSLTGMAGLTLVDSLATVQLRIDERYQQLESLQIFFGELRRDAVQVDPSSILLNENVLAFETAGCAVQYARADEVMKRVALNCTEGLPISVNVNAVSLSIIDCVGQSHAQWPVLSEGTSIPACAIEFQLSVLQEAGASASVDIVRLLDIPRVRS